MTAPLSAQQLADIRAAITEVPLPPYPDVREGAERLLAEVERLAARVADLEAERAKLVRWHEEDARQMKVWGCRVARSQRDVAAARIAGLLEAAEIVGNDDDCTCGGCDTCVPRALAAKVRDRAYALAAEGGVR